jgi:hypothetical protein
MRRKVPEHDREYNPYVDRDRTWGARAEDGFFGFFGFLRFFGFGVLRVRGSSGSGFFGFGVLRVRRAAERQRGGGMVDE